MDSYRSILEVLRWEDPIDVLLSGSVVCFIWTKAAEASELWISFCEDEGIESTVGSSKAMYREALTKFSAIPVLKGQTLRLISLDTFKLKELALQQNTSIDEGSAYCRIGRETMFCCGGWGNQVYKVNIRTGSVECEPSMVLMRGYSGVFKYKCTVYALGGKDRSKTLASGEKFSLQSEKWKLLPEYLNTPKHSFNPCIYKDEAFIVDSMRVETFNLTSERFKSLPLHLPSQSWYCLAVIRDGELIIAQRGDLLKWKVNPRDFAFRREDMAMIEEDEYWSNFTPIWKGGKVFSLYQTRWKPRGVILVDFEENVIEPFLSFEY